MSALRSVTVADLDALLLLNNDHAIETSLLDRGKLERLVEMAFLASTVEGAAALLIAFDQDAAYESVNFHWFRARLPRFVYVDRIIVGGTLRGKGVARRLYDELFATSRAHGHTLIACEVNAEPPNPASEALHASLGFVAMGEAECAAQVATPAKRVRYLTKALA